MAEVDDSFDLLFAEIMADGTGETAVAEVSDDPTPVATVEEARKEAERAEAAAQVIASGPAPKPVHEPAEKVSVDGPYFKAQVYQRLGYVSCLFPGFRFANKLVAYRDDLQKFIEFVRSPACDQWVASLEAAGLRDRGQPRKEG